MAETTTVSNCGPQRRRRGRGCPEVASRPGAWRGGPICPDCGQQKRASPEGPAREARISSALPCWHHVAGESPRVPPKTAGRPRKRRRKAWRATPRMRGAWRYSPIALASDFSARSSWRSASRNSRSTAPLMSFLIDATFAARSASSSTLDAMPRSHFFGE